MNRALVILFLSLLAAAPAVAQPAEDYRKLLVPVYVRQPVPGAFGSVWATALHGFFDGDNAPRVIRPCNLFECAVEIPPQRMVEVVPLLSIDRTSTFLFVHEDDLDSLTLQLRVQDLSRQSQTWGTELPIVPEGEAFTMPIDLLGVPIAPEFRQTLRVYSFDTEPAEVEVRIYGSGGEENLLGSRILALNPHQSPSEDAPAQGEIGWLGSEFPALPHQAVRVRIVPRTEGLRYWAFVSITNNETQHITTITPARFSSSVVAPGCSEPAAITGVSSRVAPGRNPDEYIVSFNEGTDEVAESARLSEKYGFAVESVFWLLPGLSARLYADAVADLRCEPTVRSVSFSSNSYPTPPP